MTPLKALALALAVAGMAVAAALAGPAERAKEPDPVAGERQVAVMTRNVYLGTDLNPVFSAPTLPALLAAVGAAWDQVQANDFPARAQALADEIAANEPDLVGLQEAMLFRTDTPPDGPATPAETVAYDFVRLLVDALADRGLEYEPVSTYSGTDAELPAGLPPARDVRLTDRVVILVRGGKGTHSLKLSNPHSGAYRASVTVPTAAGPVTLPRGWASVDVKLRGRSFRLVATHLEAFSPGARVAQAGELVAGPARTSLPVVLVGDMNSGPGGDLDAYRLLAGSGFADAWAGAGGPTCCHAVDLHDASATLRKRIDLVLTRGGVDTVSAEVVGEEAVDRTPSGLWPSDHAGVVVTLRLTELEH